jgi:thioesterase domain-containing protein
LVGGGTRNIRRESLGLPIPFEPPEGDLETAIAEIFADAFDIDRVGANDDFFDLGGDSLIAEVLSMKVAGHSGYEVPVSSVLENSSPRQIAALLRPEPGANVAETATRGSLVPLTQTGTRPPLFFVSVAGGKVVGFAALAHRLGPDQPFYALQQRGIDGGAPLHVSIEGMAAHYVREIRRIRPHGPYLLGGQCIGGLVAYEMARQLEARGEKVALVALLDSGGPLAPPLHPRLLAEGTPFDRVMINALRRDGAAAKKIGDAFSAQGTARLLDWLAAPVGTGVNGTVVNRYLAEVYGMLDDLRVAFVDPTGRDARRLLDWAWGHGRARFGMTEKLLPGPPRYVWLALSYALRLQSQAIMVAKRIAWRAGEAADLITRERRAGAAERRGKRVLKAASRAWAFYRAGSYGGVVTLIRSAEYRGEPLLDLWRGTDIAGIVERESPGSHGSMRHEPDVRGLAACIRELVDQTLDMPHRAT